MRHPDILPDPDEDESDVRREITPDHARAAQLLLQDLTKFIGANGEPAYLTFLNGSLGQNLEIDFVRGTAPDDGLGFIDEGLYIGERNARYITDSGDEGPFRLVVCGEGGVKKTACLAELDLRESANVTRKYIFYPDLNVEYLEENTTWDDSDPEFPLPTVTETAHSWLGVRQIHDLRQATSTFRTVGV